MRRGQRPFDLLQENPPEYYEINKEGINWQRVAQQVCLCSSYNCHYVECCRSLPLFQAEFNVQVRNAKSAGSATDILI